MADPPDRSGQLLSALVVGVLTIVGLVWAAYIQTGGNSPLVSNRLQSGKDPQANAIERPTETTTSSTAAQELDTDRDRRAERAPELLPTLREIHESAELEGLQGGDAQTGAETGRGRGAGDLEEDHESPSPVAIKVLGSQPTYSEKLAMWVSADFQSVKGSPLLTLVIRPRGAEMVRQAVVGPVEFSIDGEHGTSWHATVLRIDWENATADLVVEKRTDR